MVRPFRIKRAGVWPEVTARGMTSLSTATPFSRMRSGLAVSARLFKHVAGGAASREVVEWFKIIEATLWTTRLGGL